MASDPQQISEQMASLEDEAAIGYIHNVSPMKAGNFFECQVQTESKVMRAVCFSPQKRKQILDYSKDDVPLKIQKFRIETKYNSEDLVMDDKTVLQKYHDITFTKDSLPKTTEVQTIASLKSLCIGQLVTVKGKVFCKKEPQRIKSDLKMMEVHIIDNTDQMKLILWQDFVGKVELNDTYIFQNVRIKQDTYNKQIYINTAKNDLTSIKQCEGFTESLIIPKEYGTQKTVEGEIIGIEKAISYLACIKCTKKVSDEPTGMVTCKNCNMKQKIKACKTLWTATVAISTGDDETFTLTMFDKVLKDVIKQAKSDNPQSTKDMENLLFALPKLEVTFEKKQNKVSNVLLLY